MPTCNRHLGQLPCRWLPAPPGSLWHMRRNVPPELHAVDNSVSSASTQRATHKAKQRRGKQAVPPAFNSVTDRRFQRSVQDQQHGGPEHQPWALGRQPTDASVLKAVKQCNSWQQLLGLYKALPAHQPLEPRTRTRRKAPLDHELASSQKLTGNHSTAADIAQPEALQPSRLIKPQYAVLLLQRLSELYPSMTVWASVVMQSPLSAHAAAHATGSSLPSDASTGAYQPPAPAPGGVSAFLHSQQRMKDMQAAHQSVVYMGTGTDQDSNSLSDQWDVGVLQHSAERRPTKHATQVVGDSLDHSSNSQEEEQQAAVDSLACELVSSISAQGLQQLQPIDISLMLSALAKLAYQDRAFVAQVVHHLAVSGGLVVLRASPTALADTAWSTAKLGHDPGPQWISHFLHVTSGVLPSFSAVACTSSMWALARWGFRPADAWLEAMYACIREVAAQLGPQGVSTVTWALAMLKAQVPRNLAELLMIEAQVVMPMMSGASLATFCWALASLKHRPPGFWVDEALAYSLKNMLTVPLSARGVPFANMVWALCMWETVQPAQTWLDAFCRFSARSMPAMTSRSLAVVLQGLADLGHHPKEQWVSFALEEFHKRGSDASPLSAVTVLWSVSRLLRPPEAQGGAAARAWSPGRKWLVRYAHVLQDVAELAAAQGFAGLGPNELVDVIVALADLRYHPGTKWLTVHAACCNARIMDFSAYQIRLIRNALSALADLTEADYLPRKGEVV